MQDRVQSFEVWENDDVDYSCDGGAGRESERDRGKG